MFRFTSKKEIQNIGTSISKMPVSALVQSRTGQQKMSGQERALQTAMKDITP